MVNPQLMMEMLWANKRKKKKKKKTTSLNKNHSLSLVGLWPDFKKSLEGHRHQKSIKTFKALQPYETRTNHKAILL